MKLRGRIRPWHCPLHGHHGCEVDQDARYDEVTRAQEKRQARAEIETELEQQ